MYAFRTISLSLALGLTTAAFAAPGTMRSRPGMLNISSAVIPSGFGNEPFAVISGYLPNSCYSWDRAEVTHLQPYLHEVKAKANIRDGMCLMVLIPYSEEVPLGRLSAGEHTVRFVNGDDTYFEKTFSVE